MAFVSACSLGRRTAGSNEPRGVSPIAHSARIVASAKNNGKVKKGILRGIRDTLLRPLVTVPGARGRGDLLDCTFCAGSGKIECSGCNRTGVDALNTTCIMCDGATTLMCDVCNGVGTSTSTMHPHVGFTD